MGRCLFKTQGKTAKRFQLTAQRCRASGYVGGRERSIERNPIGVAAAMSGQLPNVALRQRWALGRHRFAVQSGFT